MEKLYNGLKLK